MYQYSNVYLYLPSLSENQNPTNFSGAFVSLQSFSRYCPSLLQGHISQKSYLKQASSPLPHILFFLNSTTTWSFTPANKSTETGLLSLASVLQHLTKLCMSSYLRLFVVLHNWILSFLLLTLYDSNTLLDFLWSHGLFLLHILYFLLFYLTFIC